MGVLLKTEDLSGIVPMLFTLGLLAGFALVCVYTARAIDEGKLNDFNAYSGEVGEYKKEEVTRDSIFQITVVGALIVIVFQLYMFRNS